MVVLLWYGDVVGEVLLWDGRVGRWHSGAAARVVREGRRLSVSGERLGFRCVWLSGQYEDGE